MSAKDTLRSNKTAILSTLCADQRLILNKVHEKQLITPREYNNLKSINKEDVEGHVVELLDKILNKGETVCQHFLDILQTDEDVKTTFPELNQLQLKEISLPKPVQESSPNEEYMLHDNKRQKREEVYQLKTRPVGLCLIINNENFLDSSVRRGTEKDAESLAKVFSWLGFRVLMCKDQTGDQMKRTLECLALLSDSTDLQMLKLQEWSEGRFAAPQQATPQHGDAFVCCILSHGRNGVVLGIDEMPLPIKHITRIFKASEQSALTGKPKVFVIQACQGGKIHKGVTLTDVEADDCSTQTIPEEADILVALATVEDYLCYRHISEGSWFVQSLCQQLNERCPKGEDITAILHHVNDDVGLKEISRMPVAKKQMPEVRFTLRKKLVLMPH